MAIWLERLSIFCEINLDFKFEFTYPPERSIRFGSEFIVKYMVRYKVVYDEMNKIFVWPISDAILLGDVM